jgi:hypothetical protein
MEEPLKNKKKVGLYFKIDIWSDFEQLCDKEGYNPSRRLEVLMIKDLDEGEE